MRANLGEPEASNAFALYVLQDRAIAQFPPFATVPLVLGWAETTGARAIGELRPPCASGAFSPRPKRSPPTFKQA
jgi:hypothetical protein